MELKVSSRTKLEQPQLAPNSGKPVHPGARPAIKVPMPFLSSPKGEINIWHRKQGHASMETQKKLGFPWRDW